LALIIHRSNARETSSRRGSIQERISVVRWEALSYHPDAT